MRAAAFDVAPRRAVPYPDAGIGRGWEASALLALTLVLVSFGMVTLYSASAVLAHRQHLPDHHYVARQAVGAGLGLLALLVCSRIPVSFWRRTAWSLALGSAAGLVLVVLPWTTAIAPDINGARRWIRAGIAVQPSEVAKLAVVVWTAALAVKKRDRLHGLGRGFLPFVTVWLAFAALLALEPDFSAAVLVVAAGVLVLFAAGGRPGHLLLLGLLAFPLVRAQVAHGYRARRIAAFLDPAASLDDAGHQLYQSLVAVGSGGLGGVGFGEGRQKFGFLPEPHNDFIFSMIAEEWGFLGVTAVVVLYLAVVVVGFRIARRAPTLFGELLAVGLTSLLALQASLHMAVGVGLLPPTGIPLPLVSFGRSNLVVTLVAAGILMGIARDGAGGARAGRPRRGGAPARAGSGG